MDLMNALIMVIMKTRRLPAAAAAAAAVAGRVDLLFRSTRAVSKMFINTAAISSTPITTVAVSVTSKFVHSIMSRPALTGFGASNVGYTRIAQLTMQYT